ncbi:MAG: anti-sigma factor [Planctomycetes bacterium]|nr:anti-sigma factor [Planctomycetota bacterium]
MNVDSTNGRNDFSLNGMKRQLRALSAVEPPEGLKKRLLAAVPQRATAEAGRPRLWRWRGVAGWVSVAAIILVFCGILWLRTPARPAQGPTPDVNSLLGGVLAADYNSVRPPDTNTLDSNGLY